MTTQAPPHQSKSSGLATQTARAAAHQVLTRLISEVLPPLGLELVALEIHGSRQGSQRLQIFIERTDRQGVGMEDCVRASRALDPRLDESTEVQQAFPGSYELEVSSPGLERPLTKPEDYKRFEGERVRVHTFRPLTAAELEHPDFAARNPKQKNFLGILRGEVNSKVRLELEGGIVVSLPQDIISKAHLDPEVDPA